MLKLMSMAAGLVLLPVVASAEIIGTALGSGAPPATLGGYVMTPFPLDPRPVFPDVRFVPSPLGGDVAFDPPMSHRRIGLGWATWSHGYTGDVYFPGGSTSARLTLPEGTRAFILYANPGPFQQVTTTVTAQDGASVTQHPHGQAGATGYGFHVTDGGTISHLQVLCDTTFSIGEFSIAVPEPTSLALLALGVLGLIRRR